MKTPSSGPERQGLHLAMMAALALISLALSWHWMSRISADDPWYRNTDMNIHNIADALCLNSGYAPGTVSQPGATSRYLLALDFRLRNEFGLLPTWTLKRFARSPDPLPALAQLVHVGREHSRLLVMFFLLVGAAFIRTVTGRLDLACLAIALLGGSAGLLFHGLLLRPELLCAGFGLLSSYGAWLATTDSRPAGRIVWLLLAGIFAGLALLSMLLGFLYLLSAVAWLLIAPRRPTLTSPGEPAQRGTADWIRCLCLASALAMVGLLILIGDQPDLLHPKGTARLRLLVLFVALAPLMHWVRTDRPLPRYLIDRSLDLALLSSGILVAFLGWYGLLLFVMPTDQAAIYMAKILSSLCYPDTWLELYTRPGLVHRWLQFRLFILDAPQLFLLGASFVLGLAFLPRLAARWRALLILLLIQAIAFAFVLSQHQFLDQYSIFTQVPLLLLWPIGLAALSGQPAAQGGGALLGWPAALATTAAFIISLTVTFQLGPKYRNFQDDRDLPVRELTITFLYDHAEHPPAYLNAMKQRYPTRADFRVALDRYLEGSTPRR